jgi:hypothetical protein
MARLKCGGKAEVGMAMCADQLRYARQRQRLIVLVSPSMLAKAICR